MFINYLKIAFRNFGRSKGFTFINIFGLAIGMAVCILLMLWVQNELSYNVFHENSDQVYSVIQEGIWNDGKTYGSRTLPYRLTPLMHELYPEIKNHVRLKDFGGMMAIGDRSFTENNVLLTEPALFEMFSFDLVAGDLQTAFDDIHNLILTEDTARKYFGDEDPMGKMIRYDNRTDFTVTGIAANPPENSTIQFDLIMQFTILGEERINSWSWESSGYIQLYENADVEAFKKKIENTIVDNKPDNKNLVRIQPLARVHLYDPLDKPQSLIFVIIFAAIGIIVLLIACINFMNLSTAKSAKRAKEVGIRKVVGADRKGLIKQFITESILTAIFAMIVAFVIVELFLPSFNDLAHKQLDITFSNINFLVSLLVITLLVGLISGSYPAFYLSHFIPSKVLKSGSGSKTKNRFRTILVVIQFTISIALIICTATVYNQLKYIQNKNLGFDKDFIISIPMNTELDDSFASFKEELLKNSNILGVTSSSSSPARVGNVNPAEWEGKADDEKILFNFFLVEKDFLKVFDMKLIEGENFSKDHQQGEPVPYIVNEAAVKMMQLENPIGKRFYMYDESSAGEIIGVVKDYHFKTLDNDIGPIMITTMKWWWSKVFVKINPRNVPESIEYIKDTFKQFAPNYECDYSFFDEEIAQYYREYYEIGSIIKYFAMLAIFISCLGLFGLASFMTEQRTKEIGIRKVLGSSAAKIVFLLTQGFSKWVLLANIFAWPIAYFAVKKFLEMFAYNTGIQIWLFAASGILALIISILTVSYQTFRAANANPIKALKYE
ncbi:MAG: ABC transporter permease [Candidatus Cloacimonetes bacterium]|nr:ABC transporter permease [Candidatus Cloacimonadota bacterium]MCF7814009.1 ABC transporter permease [Candidatus Cloacimonadota bacterium]MCF7867941.1 ABC transporter permease [Candidatus Cloacimonadota bacterium]MCF7882866.1 ABC transporter permease [Candidatus Cloacimonadota bacterium]